MVERSPKISSGEEPVSATLDSQRRITELEEEVARLQGKLQVQEDDTSTAQDVQAPMISVSRYKMIAVGVMTSVIVLTLIIVIFSFLSKGFDTAARRAAEVISPQSEQHKTQGSSSPQTEQEDDDSLARPPGL